MVYFVRGKRSIMYDRIFISPSCIYLNRLSICVRKKMHLADTYIFISIVLKPITFLAVELQEHTYVHKCALDPCIGMNQLYRLSLF